MTKTMPDQVSPAAAPEKARVRDPKLGRLWICVFVLVAIVIQLSQPAGASQNASRKYYLIMGDSIAYGFEATSPAESYAGILYEHELKRYPGLYPVSYACGGATTGSVVRGPACDSTTGSQLEQAESFLKSHRGSVAMLTIDVGINDVDNCMTTVVNRPVVCPSG